MSRVGNSPITLPSGVDVKVNGGTVTVKGKLGELSQKLHTGIKAEVNGSEVVITRSNETSEQKSLHGLSRSLINNMVLGVNEGFSKRLIMYGTGYRASQKGKGLELLAGYSHPVDIEPIGRNVLGVEGNNIITVTGPGQAGSRSTGGEYPFRSQTQPLPEQGWANSFVRNRL